MKFLIFGGTGFVGKNLAKYIKEQGGEVFSISRSEGNHSLSLDITKKSDFSKISYRPDVVVNCASRIPIKGKDSTDPEFLKELFSTNVIGACNIANWAVENKVQKLINCSTLVLVKKPWPVPLKEEFFELPDGFHVGYSMSKLSQEQVMNYCVSGSETKLLHLRLSAVYGKGMNPEGIIFALLKEMVMDREVSLTNAKINSLDLIHVIDVCKGLYHIAVNGYEEKVINLAKGKEVTIYHLAKTIKALSESNSAIKNRYTGGIPSRAVVDVTYMKKNIGLVYDNFIPLEEGLKEIVEAYIQKNPNPKKGNLSSN